MKHVKKYLEQAKRLLEQDVNDLEKSIEYHEQSIDAKRIQLKHVQESLTEVDLFLVDMEKGE